MDHPLSWGQISRQGQGQLEAHAVLESLPQNIHHLFLQSTQRHRRCQLWIHFLCPSTHLPNSKRTALQLLGRTLDRNRMFQQEYPMHPPHLPCQLRCHMCALPQVVALGALSLQTRWAHSQLRLWHQKWEQPAAHQEHALLSQMLLAPPLVSGPPVR